MELHHSIEAAMGSIAAVAFAASIRISSYIGCQKGSQLLHVASARSREEGSRDLEAVLFGDRKARTLGANMGTGAAGKLTARGRVAIDRLGDLFEAQAEDIVQEEGGAFER